MEEIIYTFILIKEADKKYLGWSKAPSVKEAGDGMQWIEWNKPLPVDIDDISYTQTELEEWYNDTYDENGELKAV